MTENQEFHLKKVGDAHIFAIELRRLALLTALPKRENHYAYLVAKQTELLSMLTGIFSEESTLDLRFISEPDLIDPTRGVVTVALVCRAEEQREVALSQAKQTLSLIQTLFDDEYAMSPVSTEEELNRLLKPFVIGDAVSILRRSERIPLELPLTTGNRPSGFLADLSTTDDEDADDLVHHVYHFVPANGPATELFRMLQHHPGKVAISVRVSSTMLEREEVRFLLGQVSRCESYLRSQDFDTDTDDDFSRREQIGVLHKSFLNTLAALQNRALEMRVQVGSDSDIPQSILQLVGHYITRQSGPSSGSLDTSAYLNGGFQIEAIPHAKLEDVSEEWSSVKMPVNADIDSPSGVKRMRWLFDPKEAVAAFHFPFPTLEELPGVDCKGFRTQLMTEPLGNGQLIGRSRHNNLSKEVRLSDKDRRRHVYAVGQTGTGKSTMFRSMILDDMRNNKGLCVMDPHGDLVEQLLQEIPEERKQDVIVFDPSDTEQPIGLNILEYKTEAEKNFLIQELVSIVRQLLPSQDMAGPIFFMHMKYCLRLVMSSPEEFGTLLQFYKIFQHSHFFKKFLPYKGNDALLQNYIESVLMKTDWTKTTSDGISTGSYIASKFEEFVSDEMIRNIFGQRRSTIDLRQIMDGGKILLVNLSKGRMGENNSRFLGMVLIAKMTAAAMSRTNIPTEERRDFYLYVDEFQNLATENFGILLAEARKYRLNLILTNQFVTQVPNFIREAITGNVGTMISFRVGSLDAEYLERDFLPVFNRWDLMNLPNFYTYVSALMNGNVTKPFSMRIISERTAPNTDLAEEIREASRLNYSRGREFAERQIDESLSFDLGKEEQRIAAELVID